MTSLPPETVFPEGRDLAAVRETVWEAQYIAKIGNWITTWERELHQHDFTAGVFVKALTDGIVTPSDLEAVKAGDQSATSIADIIKQADIEEKLFEKWWQRYTALQEQIPETPSVDIPSYVNGLEELLRHQLVARGYK